MTSFDEFRFMTCPTCGIRYAMPEGFAVSREWGGNNIGESWYCPNGHRLHFAETEYDKVRRERDLLKQQIARTEDERDAAYAAEKKAVLSAKRAEARVAAGVCPCCNRTFQQLARHMKSKHPEIVPISKRVATK